MMELPIYNSWEEKSSNFQIQKIETLDEFKNLYTEVLDSKGIFRGVAESKYKIYTSLQRQIITRELEDFNLDSYVSIFRGNPILRKYFQIFNIEPSKLSIYSYLQHYRAPSPFIDFTTNFQTAIYFGIESFDSSNYHATNTLNDYFSLFQIKQSDLELLEIPEVIRSLKKIKNLIIEAGFNKEEYAKDIVLSHIDRIFDINTCNIYLINHHDEFVDIYNTYNNIRIVLQDGLFIYNDLNDVPLEIGLKEFFKESTNYVPSVLVETYNPNEEQEENEYLARLEINKEHQKRFEKNIIHSFEINKNLIPEIRKVITVKKEDIYPNPEDLTWGIFGEAVKL